MIIRFFTKFRLLNNFNDMKIRKLLQLLTVILLLNSCSTPKVAYFQDVLPGTSSQVSQALDIRVRPEDQLSIIVNCKDPQLANLFNLSYTPQRIGQFNSTDGNQAQGISGYLVNKDGNIDFPVVGTIHVAGLSREEIAVHIKNELISKDLVKDPVVTVNFQNMTYSVMGEVTRPGRFNIDKDHITLLEALSAAGDLTIYGNRSKVLVQREEGDKRIFHQVNLNSAKDLHASPVYYLQQNDVVYVEPNNMKARQATVNGNNVRSASFWMSLTSLLTTISVLIFK